MTLRRSALFVTALALTASVITPAAVTASAAGEVHMVSVIVSETAPESSVAEGAVTAAGGDIGRRLGLIGGFAATIPASSLAMLGRTPGIAGLWTDGSVTLSDFEADLEQYDPLPPNTVWRAAIGLPSIPQETNGAGVTVAVLDTGVTRHPDLGNRVRARVDLTPDGGGYDTFGHGTHMTGLVAGNGQRSGGQWAGVATGANIVSVRVSEWNGATDVSEVLGALEWIHNNASRYGIRVLNLSFGTDSTQKHELDPLNHAVQRLWHAGILVVVAAGNRGEGGQNIDKPGDDPFVVTVGAADTVGTADPADDTVAPFSSRGPTGENVDKPDLVAPGISIVSQAAAGSTLYEMRPAARVGTQYFKGHGTSQATAIVSGVAALMFQAAPSMTPNEAKAALLGTTDPAMVGQAGAGAGLVDAAAAVGAARSRAFVNDPANVGLARSTGTGSIDSSRDNAKPYTDFNGDGVPEQVSGDIDALGNAFNSGAWAARAWNASTYPNSPWARFTNVSAGWRATPWTPGAWAGLGWDEQSWAASSWQEAGLNPGNWTARYWRAEAWN
ncbi:MAG: S8 family peptidase [Geodermatophilaceae bacterium]|nr:S8 family peptidase [Geodermatophilaceae bacterium]